MKKLLLVIFISLFLFSCEKKDPEKETLLANGYSQQEIDKILTYDDSVKTMFLNSFDERYIKLMNCSDFISNNLDRYIKFYDYFDLENLVYYVNNDIVTDSNVKYLSEIIESEYYVPSLNDLYIKELNKLINGDYVSVREMMEIVNTNRYAPYYTDIKETDISKNYLMLINKYHALSSDYEPEDLVDISSEYGIGRARKEVYDAFVNMFNDACELGYEFYVCSAYRSYDYQDGLYNKYLGMEDGNQEIVDTYSARPGHSEHQSGLCLDLENPIYGMDDFGLSEESTWINENCYKYGFIIRYTKEKENITGYQAEPWQVRYVGSSEIAKDIMDRGISFDEYYTCFVENNE